MATSMVITVQDLINQVQDLTNQVNANHNEVLSQLTQMWLDNRHHEFHHACVSNLKYSHSTNLTKCYRLLIVKAPSLAHSSLYHPL